MDVLAANFRIGALIDLCANTSQPLLRPNVVLEKQVDEDLAIVYSDQDKIRQIILNLLSNAAKFTRRVEQPRREALGVVEQQVDQLDEVGGLERQRALGSEQAQLERLLAGASAADIAVLEAIVASVETRRAVAVASTDGRVTPCNALLGEFARAACAGVLEAGGTPFDFACAAVADSSMRTTSIQLPSAIFCGQSNAITARRPVVAMPLTRLKNPYAVPRKSAGAVSATIVASSPCVIPR